MKLKDIKIGKAFKFYNTTYTKLNEDGLCILDQYADGVNRNLKYHCFDKKLNDFEYSEIKKFLHSEKYQSKGLNISKDMLKCIREITLLSEKEFFKYSKHINKFFDCFWLRSASPLFTISVRAVAIVGSLGYFIVVNTNEAVRPVVVFDLGIQVEEI